jgi:hypothetical protein
MSGSHFAPLEAHRRPERSVILILISCGTIASHELLVEIVVAKIQGLRGYNLSSLLPGVNPK